MKVNGTHAKEVAIYFLDKTTERYTPQMVAKTVVQAKSLLKAGYSKDEIIKVIDYILENTTVKLFSLGYISSSINNILDKIFEQEKIIAIQEIKEVMDKEKGKIESEVQIDIESTKRNQRKADRFGTKPWVGKEFDCNMFK